MHWRAVPIRSLLRFPDHNVLRESIIAILEVSAQGLPFPFQPPWLQQAIVDYPLTRLLLTTATLDVVLRHSFLSTVFPPKLHSVYSYRAACTFNYLSPTHSYVEGRTYAGVYVEIDQSSQPVVNAGRYPAADSC